MLFHILSASYVLVKSGSTCTRITSFSECSTAARALGLSDTTASYDEHTGSGVNYDPPYCYFEGGTLKYNSNGRNTGGCTTSDNCVCRRGTYFAYVYILLIIDTYRNALSFYDLIFMIIP